MCLIRGKLVPKLRVLLVLAIMFSIPPPAPVLAGAGRPHHLIAGAARSGRALENKAAALSPAKLSNPALLNRKRRSLTPPNAPQYHYAAAVEEATRIEVGGGDGTVAWSNLEGVIDPAAGTETQLFNSSHNDRGCIVVSFDSLVTLANGAVQAFVHQPQIDIYDMGMRLSVAAEVRGCQDSGWTTVFGYEEVGGLHSGEYGWYGGDYSGAVRAVRIEVWSGGGNILHGYRYFYLDSVRLWGVSQATLEVVDVQDQPVTALGLTDDGWPRPNPLTARVALHCPADAPVACLNSLKLELSSADQAARFYVYRTDLDTNPTCLAGPADNDFLNSYREYRLVCDRIALQPGDSAVYRWDIWVQPSIAATLNISATWGVGQAARAVKIEPAHIHPVLPGYIGAYPPQHGANSILCDTSTII